jgi:hypothetical protein
MRASRRGAPRELTSTERLRQAFDRLRFVSPRERELSDRARDSDPRPVGVGGRRPRARPMANAVRFVGGAVLSHGAPCRNPSAAEFADAPVTRCGWSSEPVQRAKHRQKPNA